MKTCKQNKQASPVIFCFKFDMRRVKVKLISRFNVCLKVIILIDNISSDDQPRHFKRKSSILELFSSSIIKV